MADSEPRLILKRNEEKRLRRGHLWVFSNEVDVEQTPLTAFAPGDEALVADHRGKILGRAYVNPHSLICARLFTRDSRHHLDQSLLVHRFNVARALRDRLYPEPYYRLAFGESDGLPGLVVDRFDDVAVVQVNTAGMERALDDVIAALRRTIEPAHILLRCDSAVRELEGLERHVRWVGSGGPDTLRVMEEGLDFIAPAAAGQKTGWYYDHRDNRARLQTLSAGARVLDVFSYCGAWAMHALAGGAEAATAIDSSADALDCAMENAEMNGFGERFTALEGDAFEVLEALIGDQARFDVVIADPPAFIKRKKDYKQGLTGYRRLNELALRLLAKDGLLVTASCSAHLAEADLVSTVLGAARHQERTMQVVAFGQQSADHPVHAAIPETRYLKGIYARMLSARSSP